MIVGCSFWIGGTFFFAGAWVTAIILDVRRQLRADRADRRRGRKEV
jgi:hypothetical protein